MMGKLSFLQVGTAAVGYHNGVEGFAKKMGMGGRAEVYDAEMAGVMMAANKAARYAAQHPEVTDLVHFVDNSAVAEAIPDC